MGVPLEPCLINWSNFSLNVPEHFSETCYIYVDKYKVDLDKDIEKIYQILK